MKSMDYESHVRYEAVLNGLGSVKCVSLVVYKRCYVVFFFSSRRRHTRFDCDWSSDVCSSDLWVMPLAAALESFELGTIDFDVILIDEASQCDVLGLAAFALGKKVVVIGDHEQVSPYAVGFETNRVQALIDEFLDGVPNKQLYDGKTSVYDLSRQAFGGVVLLVERFRCVPEIIQFSNQLCYGGEILPLREASTSQVYPHLIAHRVEGAIAKNKTNDAEA